MDSKARSRIEALLDAQSFVEIGALVKSRSTDFIREAEREASDGVICGYGSISGKPVYIYSQNRDVLSGSIGEMHGRKIAHLYDMAIKMGAPVVELLDSAALISTCIFHKKSVAKLLSMLCLNYIRKRHRPRD